MRKALIIATVAVAAVGGTALAYKAYARYDHWGHGRWHRHMDASDMTAFAEARIAALKAGLQLTTEQEQHWPPVEAALRELAGKHIERREQFRAAREGRDAANPIERLRLGADRLSEVGADLKRLADTAEPLYQSLDDAQKRRLDALAHRGMRDRMHRWGGWRRHGDLGDQGRHMGPPHGGPHAGYRRIEFDDGPRTGFSGPADRL